MNEEEYKEQIEKEFYAQLEYGKDLVIYLTKRNGKSGRYERFYPEDKNCELCNEQLVPIVIHANNREDSFELIPEPTNRFRDKKRHEGCKGKIKKRFDAERKEQAYRAFCL